MIDGFTDPFVGFGLQQREQMRDNVGGAQRDCILLHVADVAGREFLLCFNHLTNAQPPPAAAPRSEQRKRVIVGCQSIVGAGNPASATYLFKSWRNLLLFR